jgi:hypothetical protein
MTNAGHVEQKQADTRVTERLGRKVASVGELSSQGASSHEAFL